MTARTIAIDGPAGAGKSTVAKLVAKKLGYLYIDTGAMYRTVAYRAIAEGIAFDDNQALSELTNRIRIELANTPDGYKVYCDGQDVSDDIRTPEVSAASSPVSAAFGVRLALVEQQRRMAEHGGVVMDGRDIGTNVLPNADCKIFLTASIEERAKRRTKDLEAKGIKADIRQVADDIRERDQRDSTRANAPLACAPDAFTLDTTDLTIGQVVEAILDLAAQKTGADA